MQKIHPLLLMIVAVVTLMACKPGVYYSPYDTVDANNKPVKAVKMWGSHPKDTGPVAATPFPVDK